MYVSNQLHVRSIYLTYDFTFNASDDTSREHQNTFFFNHVERKVTLARNINCAAQA